MQHPWQSMQLSQDLCCSVEVDHQKSGIIKTWYHRFLSLLTLEIHWCYKKWFKCILSTCRLERRIHHGHIHRLRPHHTFMRDPPHTPAQFKLKKQLREQPPIRSQELKRWSFWRDACGNFHFRRLGCGSFVRHELGTFIFPKKTFDKVTHYQKNKVDTAIIWSRGV